MYMYAALKIYDIIMTQKKVNLKIKVANMV